MRILEHRALPGPNVHSRYPTIHMVLDIHPYQDTPTDEMPHFQRALLEALPGLEEHRCSVGRRGGFIERLERGTWLAHVAEHVAIELQCRAGIEVGFGKTRMRSPTVYTVAYRYRSEQAGLAAGEMAVDLVEALARGKPVDVAAMVAELRRLHRRDTLGPSTQALVDEALRRGIPVTRLNEASHIQLGHGARQQRIQASLTGQTSCLGAEIADDKLRTKHMLAEAGVPVPRGEAVSDADGAVRAAQRLGYPVVVKPVSGNHGRGITTGLRTEEAVRHAFGVAAAVHPDVIVEEHLEGGDFRVLVVGHRFVAAAQRVPASVTSLAGKTVRQLIDEANADPRRGDGHEAPLTRIPVDDETLRVLATQGLGLDDVPPAGRVLRLRDTANLSTGGTAIDVTDHVHPSVQRMSERVSRLVGLDVMGLDIVAPDLSAPLEGRRAGVVEVNAAPGLRMHMHPTMGKPRDVAKPILDLLFPDGDGRIPIVAVTGTNGKTTTVALIAHILEAAGARVGMACTDGVRIGPDMVLRGDYAGPAGARAVLSDPWVDHAVLEVARGGIIRRGLGFDEAAVGVFLNVSSDHLGESGIEDLDDMAHVKSVVVENISEHGHAVLNYDDTRVAAHAPRPERTVFFSAAGADLRGHVEAGGVAVGVEDGWITVRSPRATQRVAAVRRLPLLHNGAASFNLQNVLAAVGAASSLGVPLDAVRHGLTSFLPTPETLPGRGNVLDVDGVRVLVDYGHNAAAIEALAPLVKSIGAGRRIAMANGSGNRRDADLRAFGRALARLYDHVVLCDPDPRQRAPGETLELVRQGLLEGGLGPDAVERAPDEPAAVARALAIAQPGDLVVIQPDDIRGALARVQRRRGAAPGLPAPMP